MFLVNYRKMYIIDNSNCYYSEKQIKNYILDINEFEVLQNIDSAFEKKVDGCKLVYR